MRKTGTRNGPKHKDSGRLYVRPLRQRARFARFHFTPVRRTAENGRPAYRNRSERKTFFYDHPGGLFPRFKNGRRWHKCGFLPFGHGRSDKDRRHSAPVYPLFGLGARNRCRNPLYRFTSRRTPRRAAVDKRGKSRADGTSENS